MRTRTTVISLTLWVLAACGGASSRPDGLGADRLLPVRLYPLDSGYAWSYDVDTGSGVNTLAISRVESKTGHQVQVVSGGTPVVYEVREDGIVRTASGTYLLKKPIEVGAEWESTNGATARVASVDEAVRTVAGSFRGCAKVVESGGATAKTVTTVYCPDVGPVVVDSRMRSDKGDTVSVTARLRGYQLGVK